MALIVRETTVTLKTGMGWPACATACALGCWVGLGTCAPKVASVRKSKSVDFIILDRPRREVSTLCSFVRMNTQRAWRARGLKAHRKIYNSYVYLLCKLPNGETA